MLHWLRIEWLFLKGLWAWLTLTPLARTAVRNSSPETWQRIDAILDERRDNPGCTPGGSRGKVPP